MLIIICFASTVIGLIVAYQVIATTVQYYQLLLITLYILDYINTWLLLQDLPSYVPCWHVFFLNLISCTRNIGLHYFASISYLLQLIQSYFRPMIALLSHWSRELKRTIKLSCSHLSLESSSGFEMTDWWSMMNSGM